MKFRDEDGFSTLTGFLFDEVMAGAPDLEARREALAVALRAVRDMSVAASKSRSSFERWTKGGQEAANINSDTALIAGLMLEMLDPLGLSDLKLELGPRRRGKRTDWPKRRKELQYDNRMARIVERLVASGKQKESAVLTVADSRKTTRKRIYAALAKRDWARSIVVDANERELLSLIMARITD